MIYEAHVKGMTMRHPDIPDDVRGTYAGLAHPAMIEHFRSLGVTAVELMPVHQFVHDSTLVEQGPVELLGLQHDRLLRPAQRLRELRHAAASRCCEFKTMVRDAAPPDGQTVTAAVKEGFAYLFKSRELVLLSAAVMAFNVGWNMAAATFVLYAKESLRVSDFTFGLLVAASAVGGILAGWTARSILRSTGIKGGALGSMLVQAVGWLTILASNSVWVAGVGYALVGAAATLSTVAVVSARQHAVPDHLLGRVVSAFRLMGNGVAPLGAAAGGLIASAFGLHAPFLVAVAVLVVSAVALAYPLLRTSE